MSKRYWKCTLLSGDVVDDPRCEGFRVDDGLVLFSRVYVVSDPFTITVGHLWWKREITHERNDLREEPLYTIPVHNIALMSHATHEESQDE